MKTISKEMALQLLECLGDSIVMEASRTGLSNDWYRVYEERDLNDVRFVWVGRFGNGQDTTYQIV